MKSSQIKRYGGSEVVEINQSASLPNDPSEGNVLVNVKAAGVNPSDWKLREGFFKQMVPLQFPATLGMDFSGVIEKVGVGVASDLKQGDEVYGQSGVFAGGSGAFAEMALANADKIAHKPKTLTHEQAAGLPLVGVSAWQALVETIGLSKGQKILIHGGAGGIGSIAIQLAKHLGAYVATTVSTNDIQFVKEELGADEVIDYETQTFENVLPHDFDAVFDTVGGETYTRSFKVLKRGGGSGGIIVSMLEQPVQELMDQFGVKAVFLFSQVNRERLTKLAEWVDQNNIRVNVERTFPLDEARAALDYQRDVHPRGKIVLAMQ
ncbi:MAG TPA: NADP-dependent oxidoreductase [Nitrososphaeraceae archaeon]|jgi:NADPH:quinone reductase-like Zn-dependent oxidoreductase|nr:NADP-dependent oxidoreductase [Nitrososphaeraceae archaeon]